MLAVLVLIARILMLLVLFSFFGWAMYTLWRDLTFQSQNLVDKKIPALVVSRTGENEDAKLIFTQPELIIGRDPSCQIQLNDETASNQHARLYYRNRQWWIEDLFSTNGTYLNDERLETPTIIISGDEIRIGKTSFIIDFQATT